MKTLISNSTRHHSYQTALALHEAGILSTFVTGIYYNPRSIRARALERALTVSGHESELSRLRSRRVEELPPSKVTTIYWPEVAEEIWCRSRLLSGLLPRESATHLRHEAFDLQVAAFHIEDCDIFHGFEQCARFSMARARSKGAVTVLDEPVIHRATWDRIEAQERDALGLAPPKRPPWFKHHVERKYRELEMADHLFVGLDFVRRSFIENGFPAERIHLVPYGADVSRFRPVDRGDRSTFNILFVGQISWYKGLHRFLDAYEAFDGPEAALTVIGFVHEEWREYFEDRFRRLRNRVRFLETVGSEQVRHHFEEADVFVFPSLGGGVGLAVYEAMASGLPVITTDGDVVIRDGIEGLVVPGDDTEGWTRSLQRLHDDPGFRAKLGAAARERVGMFTWSAYRDGVRREYERIAASEGIAGG